MTIYPELVSRYSVEDADIITPELPIEYEMWPLDAPGIAIPGQGFITEAIMLGDGNPEFVGKSATKKQLVKYGHWLKYCYTRATYEPDFSMKVNFHNVAYPVTFLPGMIADGDSYGPKPTDIMIVGKIPTQEEVNAHQPLLGDAMELLKETLEDLGQFDYVNWYITNIIKFPHPQKFAGGGIPVEWVKDCLPIFHQELRLVKPKYILCLGGEALNWVLGKRGISVMAATGEVFMLQVPMHKSAMEEPVFHEVKVVACVSPSACLRQTDTMPQFKTGVESFNCLITEQEVQSDESDIDHRVIDNAEELEILITEIMKNKANASIALDGEWQGNFPDEQDAYLRTIQFSWQPKKAVCVVLRHAGGADAFKPNIGTAIKLLNRLCKRTQDWPARAIGHFFRADLPWFIHEGLDLREEYDAPADDVDLSIPGARFGWEKTSNEGGADTGLMAHSIVEAEMTYKLEVLANKYLRLFRYDKKLQEWKTRYCKELKLEDAVLEGYGMCPDEILHPYSMYDADATRRLFELFNKPGGLLDNDQNGNSCREAFWISQRCSLAFLEMERTGICYDHDRALEMTEVYQNKKIEMVEILRESVNWPDLNIASHVQTRELLFGVGYSGSSNKDGKAVKVSPAGARLLNLTPIKTTGKRPKQWADIRDSDKHMYQPAADKESLGALSFNPDAKLLRNIRFVGQLLTTSLRPPKTDQETGEYLIDDDDELVYEKGLSSYVNTDGRIRTHLFQVKESGRASSSRPNLQSISSRRESDYKNILGKDYKYSLRSVFHAAPGHVLIEADYSGAELYALAIMSQCPAMIDHCMRGTLPESDPNYYDIHSNMAVTAFRLTCAPTKAGLKSIGNSNLRVGAKCILFGLAYGRGGPALVRAIAEEGVEISLDDVRKLVDTIFNMYPEMKYYLDKCKERATEVGWLANCFNRYRRFSRSSDRSAIGDIQRSAMNYPIQSAIADGLSTALSNMYRYRDNFTVSELSYKIVLVVHDSAILEVPIKFAKRVYEEVLPKCMTDNVDIWPTDFDGKCLPGISQPYHIGIDRKIMLRWGESIKPEEARKIGLDLSFIK